MNTVVRRYVPINNYSVVEKDHPLIMITEDICLQYCSLAFLKKQTNKLFFPDSEMHPYNLMGFRLAKNLPRNKTYFYIQ